MKNFSVLLEQQEALEKEMDHIKNLAKKRPDDIEPINRRFQKFKTLLALHSEIEEQLVYKKLIEMSELRDLILKARQSYHVINTLLLELRVLSFATESWLPKFLVFRDHLLKHMNESEDLIYKKANKVMTASQLTDLKNSIDTLVKERKV